MFDVGDVVQLIDCNVPEYGDVNSYLKKYFIIRDVCPNQRTLYIIGGCLIEVKYDNVKLILKGKKNE